MRNQQAQQPQTFIGQTIEQAKKAGICILFCASSAAVTGLATGYVTSLYTDNINTIGEFGLHGTHVGGGFAMLTMFAENLRSDNPVVNLARTFIAGRGAGMLLNACGRLYSTYINQQREDIAGHQR